MKYKKVGIEDYYPFSKSPEEKKNIIFIEYIFYSIVSFLLSIYFTIKLGINCHKLAEKYNYKLDGLVKGFSFLGGYRDLSDFQWKYYRENLKIIIIFAIIFIFISKLIKVYFSLKILKYFYLLFGLAYGFFLHRIKIIYLIAVLFISYTLCNNYSILGKRNFIALTWIFCIIIKVTSEIWDGYSINFLNISDFLKYPLLGWNGVFGLIMLKILSFNLEFSNVIEKDIKNNNLTNMAKIMEHCNDCKEGRFCLTALKFVYVKESDFTFSNFLIYIFYPPFYFSGPIIMFHSFIFQVNNVKSNRHNDFDRNKKIYFLRCIFVFVVFEIFNHYIYVNAIMTNKNNSWIFEEFRNSNSYFYYFFLAFNNLVFIFLKFSLIWKNARLWGWVDGIYSEENMNRCIYNNYNFEGFWRQWHRSYNIWLIRYMYIPLGGKQKKLLNTFIIFSFVALWHDLKFNLLLWAWCIYISLIPEIIIKNYFEKRLYLNNYIWFRYLKSIISSFTIILMIIANLIGFGIGNKELVDALYNLLKLTTPFRFIEIIIFFFPFTFAMFMIRDIEKMYGIKKNF